MKKEKYRKPVFIEDLSEEQFDEEMKKGSFRGWLFAKLLPKMNDRWALFEW